MSEYQSQFTYPSQFKYHSQFEYHSQFKYQSQLKCQTQFVYKSWLNIRASLNTKAKLNSPVSLNTEVSLHIRGGLNMRASLNSRTSFELTQLKHQIYFTLSLLYPVFHQLTCPSPERSGIFYQTAIHHLRESHQRERNRSILMSFIREIQTFICYSSFDLSLIRADRGSFIRLSYII